MTVGLCLFVAGKLLATLPVTEFTLAWTHSVEKTRWEEHYRIEGVHLVLERAQVQGSGAGMEPAPDAVWRDGSWSWTPRTGPLRELRLTESSFTADYQLCTKRGCRPLHALTGKQPDGTMVVAAPCAAKAPR